MATCPSGHQSASDDFCDVCGVLIGAAPSLAPDGAPAEAGLAGPGTGTGTGIGVTGAGTGITGTAIAGEAVVGARSRNLSASHYRFLKKQNPARAGFCRERCERV